MMRLTGDLVNLAKKMEGTGENKGLREKKKKKFAKALLQDYLSDCVLKSNQYTCPSNTTSV